MKFERRLTMAQREKLTISLDKEVKDMLKALANHKSTSMTRVLEGLVRNYFLNYQKFNPKK